MFIKATASHNLCAILLYHTKGTYSRISSKTSTFSRVRSASRAYGGRTASFRAYGVPYENGQQGICFPLHIGSPTEAHRKKLVFLFTGKIPIEARRTFHKDKPHPIRP